MGYATKATVSIIGVICGISGLEHGFFELLQGNTATEIHLVNGSPMIYAIGAANRFWPFGFEYAFTLVHNYLITGILAMTVSLAVILWAVGPIQKRNGWLIFILLSVCQYLVGGGAAQIGPAVVVGLVAIAIHHPALWLRSILPFRIRQALSTAWLWLLIVLAFIFIHSMVTAIFGVFIGVSDPNQVIQIQWGMLDVMFVLFPLTILCAFVHDSLETQSQSAAQGMD